MIDKVLLVEDDPIAVMLCKKVIEKDGFARDIDVAHNGQLAIEYYQGLLQQSNGERLQNCPQLILLDLNMPVLGGWEFLDEFLQTYFSLCRDTRVVILSSSIVPSDREKAERIPVVIDFLSKPISVNDLQELSQKLEAENSK